MTDNLVQLRTCPRCGGGSFKGRQFNRYLPRLWHTRGPPSIGVDEKEQEKIFDTIHKCAIIHNC